MVTTDLTGDERWPRLVRLPGTNAARSVISVGLVVGGTGTGLLTLYADVGGQFGHQAVRIGDMLAAHAAAALGRTLEPADIRGAGRGVAAGLRLARRHRASQRDPDGTTLDTADEAFHLLCDTSQRLNVKLRVIAEQVVTQRRLPDA